MIDRVAERVSVLYHQCLLKARTGLVQGTGTSSFAMRGYLAVSPPCCCSRSSPLQHTAMPWTSAGRLCGGLRRVLLSQLGAVDCQSMRDMTRGSFRHMAIRAATKTEAPADANTSAKVRAGHAAGVDVLTVASCLEEPALCIGLLSTMPAGTRQAVPMHARAACVLFVDASKRGEQAHAHATR